MWSWFYCLCKGIKMKKVVNIIDGVPQIMEVPDNYVQCSISGEFRPPEEFMRGGEIVRTNCTRTYEMPSDDMEVLRRKIFFVKHSPEYSKLVNGLRSEVASIEWSIPAQQMIDWLKTLVEHNPNARVCITQDGYYAWCGYAEIHDPILVSGTENVYTIGHSSQNP